MTLMTFLGAIREIRLQEKLSPQKLGETEHRIRLDHLPYLEQPLLEP